MTLQEKCMHRIISKFSDMQLRNALHGMNNRQHLVVNDFVIRKHRKRDDYLECANCGILFFYNNTWMCNERFCFNRYCSEECTVKHTSLFEIQCTKCGKDQRLYQRCKICIKEGVRCVRCNRKVK